MGARVLEVLEELGATHGRARGGVRRMVDKGTPRGSR